MGKFFKNNIYKQILRLFPVVLLIFFSSCGGEKPEHPPIDCEEAIDCIDFFCNYDVDDKCNLLDQGEHRPRIWSVRNISRNRKIKIYYYARRKILGGSDLPNTEIRNFTINPISSSTNIDICKVMEEEISGVHRHVDYYEIVKVRAEVVPQIFDKSIYLEDCEDKCKDGASSFECLKLDMTINVLQGIITSKFNELYELISVDSNFPIPMTKLLDIFQLDQDPCERREIILDEGNIKNEGLDCLIAFAGTDISTGQEVEGKISLDSVIEINRTVNDESISLVPNHSRGVIYLVFNEDYYNDNFGGYISKIVMKKEGVVIIQTYKEDRGIGCIRFDYKF